MKCLYCTTPTKSNGEHNRICENCPGKVRFISYSGFKIVNWIQLNLDAELNNEGCLIQLMPLISKTYLWDVAPNKLLSFNFCPDITPTTMQQWTNRLLNLKAFY